MQTVSHACTECNECVSDVGQPELVAACPAPVLSPTKELAELRGVATGKSEQGQPFAITLTAYAVGRDDAQHDEPFAPELIFIKPQDLYDYSIGFLAIRPDCIPAQAMAAEFEQQQYELARGEEPAWLPAPLDFDVTF